MSKLGQELEKLQAQSTTDQANHDSAQKHYQAVSAGLSSNTDGEAASLNDQLMSKSTHWKKGGETFVTFVFIDVNLKTFDFISKK